MTPAWLLLTRLDGMIARLEQAQKAITTQSQNTRLHKRIGNDLARRLSEHVTAIKVRRAKVAATGIVPSNAWSEVKSSSSATLLDECLLYLQAARSRGPDADPELCEITDALFDELAAKTSSVSWKSFSVFASEDSFDGLTRIIRVRYPVSGVWDIPVAVHEYGHFLSGNLKHIRDDGSPVLVFQDLRNSVVPPQKALAPTNAAPQTQDEHIDWSAWLDEIFADVFATYAVGPSFACSCLFFRFDPSSAEEELDGKHPSYAKRSYVILETLRRLNKEQPGRDKLGRIIWLLEDSWRAACDAAGSSASVADNYQTWLNGQISNIYYILRTDEGGIRFNAWDAAQDKESWIDDPPESASGFTITELLNAAWICRVNGKSTPERLSDNFVKLARKRIERND
jgi:hypothetical protein